ncbi:MAG: S9 family peptidase [Rhodothermales bacterium]
MKHSLLIGLAAVLFTFTHTACAQVADHPELTLDAIHNSATFVGESFEGGRWAAEGPVITFIEFDQASQTTDLVSFNLETEQRTTLIDGSRLLAADVARPIYIEDYAYSADGTKVLLYTDSERVWRLNTKGFYYLYDTASGDLQPIASRADGYQMFAKLDPAGERVAFVRNRDLFVVDLETMTETRLTNNGAPGGIINGTSDWVYEEEFGLRDGWQWSPDGRYLAFFQFDETNTREFAMTDLREQYPTYERFRYPKAGETNSEVRIGVIDMTTQATRFFDTKTWQAGGERYEYISQIGWTPEVDGAHQVGMLRLNRDQNRVDLLYGHPATGEVTTVLEEREPTWIEVENGFSSQSSVGKITYLRDGQHFVWQSETDGYLHLQVYTNQGERRGSFTSGEWEVTEFHGVDEENGLAYFTAAKDSALERHLYRTSYRFGDGGLTVGEPMKITDARGTHRINMSSDLRYYIDSHSSAAKPTTVTLHRADGAQLDVLEDNSDLILTLADHALPTPEFTTVPGAGGTPLNAYLIKPSTFDESQNYPLLMYVYGGPGSQTVTDSWGGSRYLWHAYLAEKHGIIVASVDNRGTGGRGKAFKSATYKQLGLLESADQIAAAQHFGAMDYIDADRIGIWGWSYGGYMTLMALLTEDGPATFKTGVSVAPVTDWRLYDTIYTERYMSTPQANPDGYRTTAPLAYADRLSDDQDLLMIHGDFDDNVHFQNAVQMADAFQAANKQFEFMMYPGRNHGIYGGSTRLHLFTLVTNFLVRTLDAEASGQPGM